MEIYKFNLEANTLLYTKFTKMTGKFLISEIKI